MLVFMRELQQSSVIRYEAKLLIVGEGGVGKSSLLRALQGEVFEAQLNTTHGIDVEQVKLHFPELPEKGIKLDTWDFGGQQIYHATHQFFYTKRSIYMVVWSARLGAEHGRLHYWLENIRVLAPGVPVILVTTHIDERAPDLNYSQYKNAYPQIVMNLSISNKTGDGIANLKATLARMAMQLPLMGQPWPRTWVDAEQALFARSEQYIDAEEYIACCTTHGVEADIAYGTLGDYLHDLGKIHYFHDDPLLQNLVILHPNWINKAISSVLDDETTANKNGILHISELPRIWSAYDPHLYSAFLRLMERFDLCYPLEADLPGTSTTSILIPQLLPYQPPFELPIWSRRPKKGEEQVEMA